MRIHSNALKGVAIVAGLLFAPQASASTISLIIDAPFLDNSTDLPLPGGERFRAELTFVDGYPDTNPSPDVGGFFPFAGVVPDPAFGLLTIDFQSDFGNFTYDFSQAQLSAGNQLGQIAAPVSLFSLTVTDFLNPGIGFSGQFDGSDVVFFGLQIVSQDGASNVFGDPNTLLSPVAVADPAGSFFGGLIVIRTAAGETTTAFLRDGVTIERATTVPLPGGAGLMLSVIGMMAVLRRPLFRRAA